MKKRNRTRAIARICLAVIALSFIVILASIMTGCEYDASAYNDTQSTIEVANKLQSNQPTPTDIDYSLERYNLIRRAYWVNGQREKAISLPCPVEKPLSYVVLFSGNTVVGSFVVDGKVSSLNSYLTPDSEYYEIAVGGDAIAKYNDWLSDVDGSYGTNDAGIFFFTPDGKYLEWTGTYLYSDIPFEIDDPVVRVGESND